jgi:Holliday junction DNA helicase RuvB
MSPDNTIHSLESKIASILYDEPDLVELFERILAYEKSKANEPWDGKGIPPWSWEWYEVQGDPRVLNRLVASGILRIVYKSNKSTHYVLADRDAVERALAEINSYQPVEEAAEIPGDLFSVIHLHDDKKEILMRALNSEKPVHILLVGSVATAKSLFLMELSRLPGAEYILGSSLTKAGLYDLMFTKSPRYLCIDEIEKVSDYENISCLLSLMETGILSETKYRRRRVRQFKTWVFAGANRDDTLPPEILSRFRPFILRFREYTPEEFLEVAVKVLVEREGVSPPLAQYIAEKTLNELYTRDVRAARNIARVARTREDVDRIVENLRKR